MSGLIGLGLMLLACISPVYGAQMAHSGKLTAVCVGQALEFSLPFKAAPGTVISLEWNFDDPASGADNQSLAFFPKHRFDTPGQYDVELVFQTNRGEWDTLDFPILVLAPPLLSFEIDRTCLGDSTHVRVGSSRADLGRIKQWNWAVGGKVMHTPNELRYRFPKTGDYELGLEIETAGGCRIDTSFSLLIHDRPEAPLVPLDTFCMGTAVVLEAIAPATSRIRWYEQAHGKTPIGEGHRLYMEPAYFSSAVFVEQQGAGACNSPRVRVPVKVFSPGELRISHRPAGPVKLDSAVIFALETTASLKQVKWTIAGKEKVGGRTTKHAFSVPGRYEIDVLATHINGCEVSLKRWVNVLEGAKPALPVAFSPNGDGINDQFAVEDSLLKAQIKIFNRWGQLVYTAEQPDFSWDGRELDGQHAPDGVYVYRLQGTGRDGKEFSLKGVLTLIR